jgi:predicted RNA methylase
MSVDLERLERQQRLDASRTKADRNKLGQFATPPGLALDILQCASRLLPPGERVRFLDPALGTGAFYSALRQVFPADSLDSAVGYEVDEDYGQAAKALWGSANLQVRITDFTKAEPPSSDAEKANLVICNPPYVRHHHIDPTEKKRLRAAAELAADLKPGGLTGLYGYFLLIAHRWMAENGLAGWLIPSEFLDVNYGRQLKRYLLENVTLLRIHRFDPSEVQFDDALVSSAVLWFRNAPPPSRHLVEFTFGGTLAHPVRSGFVSNDALQRAKKWTHFPRVGGGSGELRSQIAVDDLFTIKRGIATGANAYFCLTPETIIHYRLPPECLWPILPSPRHVPDDEIMSDKDGNPVLHKRLFMLKCRLPEQQIRLQYPSLWRYLEMGIEQGIHKRYLCRHRTPWYALERRSPAPLLCTYMGRSDTQNGRPFRFILNHSRAVAANVYLLMYPKPHLEGLLKAQPALLREIWQMLNDIPVERLIRAGRIYGGGLHKLEPRELAAAPADNLLAVLPESYRAPAQQLALF